MLAAIATMVGLGLLLCVALGVAQARLGVETDPREAAVRDLLPGANCGNCGFAGCDPYASAIATGAAGIDRCTVGGPPVQARLAALLGVDAVPSFPVRPVIHCGATASQRLGTGGYQGTPTCAAADVTGGVQACSYGCLGFGDCVASCEYGAMTLVDGLPRIDYAACVGCGACVRACPRGIIEQVPFKQSQMAVVACANHDPGAAVREVCQVGCIGCKRCERALPGVFTIDDSLASIDYAAYTAETEVEAARETCPMKSILWIGTPPPSE